jgi:SAM-dependent methyltransferase
MSKSDVVLPAVSRLLLPIPLKCEPLHLTSSLSELPTGCATPLFKIQNKDMPAPHSSLERQIVRYYESGQEAERLESPFSRWEKVRTLDILDRFLPPAPALILDVGGAAGAYAFPLAEKGYVVDLIDPVPLHIEQAKQRAAIDQRVPRSFQVGDARAIPCEDASADAVLFFGPL